MSSGRIPKIVLTGGPCAGKTTALSKLRQRLEDLGYTVIVVTEAATDLILAGIQPRRLGPSGFQGQIIGLTQEKERRMLEAARLMPGDRKVILCDRGLADVLAYIPPHEADLLLGERGLNLVSLRDEPYDAVIHLRSLAFDKPDLYSCENNIARSETVEQAAALDERTLAAWTGHSHLRIVDNSGDGLEGKIDRVLREVCSVLGIPAPVEIERKYKITGVDIGLLPSPHAWVDITQYYLTTGNPDIEERVRIRSQGGGSIYFHTTKKKIGPGTRTEIERQVTKEEHLALLARADPNCRPIQKKRCCFPWNGLCFELDVFSQPPGLILLEVELTDINQEVTLPPFLADRAVDVTDDKAYSNRMLATVKS